MANLLSRSAIMLLGCVFIYSGNAWGDEHVYRIYNFHGAIDAPCQDEAEDLGQRLAAEEDVQVLGAVCEHDESTDRTTVGIRYRREAPLNLVSTYTFESTYDPKGLYRSRRECQRNLSADRSTFREQTRLEAFLSFCAKDRSRGRWYPHIDAFGNARRIPSRSSWKSDQPIGWSQEEMFDFVADRLSDRGVFLSHLVWNDSPLRGGATAFYYAPPEQVRMPFSSKVAATLPGIGACKSQADALDHQLSERDDIDSLITFCSSPWRNPRNFELNVVYVGRHWLDLKYSSSSYDSLRLCEANRPAITDQLRSVYGDRIKGSVCGLTPFSNDNRDGYYVIALKQLGRD